MLEEFGALHDDLLARIADLERLLAGPLDRAALTGARWRLSAASRKRRRYVDRLISSLLSCVSRADAGRLLDLREAGIADQQRSAAHVAHWSTERILADPDGYRVASDKIRAGMRARVALERAVLGPILDGMEGDAAMPGVGERRRPELPANRGADLIDDHL